MAFITSEQADEEEDDKWCYDDNMIQLNHGYCFVRKHPKTSDEDWKLFLESCNEEGYSEEMFNKIKNRLIERDGKIYGKIYCDNWVYEEEEVQ
jgi:hypothetical protein